VYWLFNRAFRVYRPPQDDAAKLIDITARFATDDNCLYYIEKMRWPNGVCCIRCGVQNISKITSEKKGKNQRTRIYQCLERVREASGRISYSPCNVATDDWPSEFCLLQRRNRVLNGA
jgi:hypothetical protein